MVEMQTNYRSCKRSRYRGIHDGVIVVEMDGLVDVNIEFNQHHHLLYLPS